MAIATYRYTKTTDSLLFLSYINSLSPLCKSPDYCQIKHLYTKYIYTKHPGNQPLRRHSRMPLSLYDSRTVSNSYCNVSLLSMLKIRSCPDSAGKVSRRVYSACRSQTEPDVRSPIRNRSEALCRSDECQDTTTCPSSGYPIPRCDS